MRIQESKICDRIFWYIDILLWAKKFCYFWYFARSKKIFFFWKSAIDLSFDSPVQGICTCFCRPCASEIVCCAGCFVRGILSFFIIPLECLKNIRDKKNLCVSLRCSSASASYWDFQPKNMFGTKKQSTVTFRFGQKKEGPWYCMQIMS